MPATNVWPRNKRSSKPVQFSGDRRDIADALDFGIPNKATLRGISRASDGEICLAGREQANSMRGSAATGSSVLPDNGIKRESDHDGG